jgi:hypothetical protein
MRNVIEEGTEKSKRDLNISLYSEGRPVLPSAAAAFEARLARGSSSRRLFALYKLGQLAVHVSRFAREITLYFIPRLTTGFSVEVQALVVLAYRDGVELPARQQLCFHACFVRSPQASRDMAKSLTPCAHR